MKPSTSLGTTSNVGMENPSPSVRPTGNMRCLLVIGGVCRSSVSRECQVVNSRRRCRVILHPLGEPEGPYRWDDATSQRAVDDTDRAQCDDGAVGLPGSRAVPYP